MMVCLRVLVPASESTYSPNKKGKPMSRLNGTYENPTTGETLVITNADDHHGTFSGTLSGKVDDQEFTLKVNGTYHFFANTGNYTTLSFNVWQHSTPPSELPALPELRESWVGFTIRPDYRYLVMKGARFVLNNDRGGRSLDELNGNFDRRES
jgi:hypothetical protein